MFDKYSTDPRNSLEIPVSNRHATEVDHHCGTGPNVVVEWLALLRIMEVPHSNLGLVSGCPD
jgi:hypothetical protein